MLAGTWTAFALVAATWTASEPEPQSLRLAALFSDHTVLQRDTDAAIFGWGPPGAEVSVRASFLPADADPALARCRDDGSWKCTVRTPGAGGPYQLTVRCGEQERIVRDVLLGEVWLCSGQSNMQWPLSKTDAGAEAIAAADDPGLRLFAVPRLLSVLSESDVDAAWSVANPETAASFSAVAWHFGRDLRRLLLVPVGLIGSSWGGTPAEAWTSGTALRELGDFESAIDAVARASKDPETARIPVETRLAAYQKQLAALDPGLAESWSRSDFDDRAWPTMTLPQAWEKAGLQFDGIVWYRREFEVPANAAGAAATLELGPIDDLDQTWVNGTPVGETRGASQWQVPRVYEIPAGLLRAGRNVVCVRVHDTGGGGGLHGSAEQMRVHGPNLARIPLSGRWRYRATMAQNDLPTPPSSVAFSAKSPSVLFGGMIAPLTDYAIRGAIWYQGEANRNRAEQYVRLFPKMVECWRREWGIGDFPLYYVQIAPYRYKEAGAGAALRDAQRRAMAKIPNSGMVVTSDVADLGDIHPRAKKPVGQRLARWALRDTYDSFPLTVSGPLPRVAHRDGSGVRVFFEHAYGGLSTAAELRQFEVAAEGGPFVAAEARVEGDTVLVWSDQVKEPIRVRHGWTNDTVPELFNAAGLPSSTFAVRVSD